MNIGKPLKDSINDSIYFNIDRLMRVSIFDSMWSEIKSPLRKIIKVPVNELVPNPINKII